MLVFHTVIQFVLDKSSHNLCLWNMMCVFYKVLFLHVSAKHGKEVWNRAFSLSLFSCLIVLKVFINGFGQFRSRQAQFCWTSNAACWHFVNGVSIGLFLQSNHTKPGFTPVHLVKNNLQHLCALSLMLRTIYNYCLSSFFTDKLHLKVAFVANCESSRSWDVPLSAWWRGVLVSMLKSKFDSHFQKTLNAKCFDILIHIQSSNYKTSVSISIFICFSNNMCVKMHTD